MPTKSEVKNPPNREDSFVFSELSSKNISLSGSLLAKGTSFVHAITKLVIALIIFLFAFGLVFGTTILIWSTIQ